LLYIFIHKNNTKIHFTLASIAIGASSRRRQNGDECAFALRT